MIQTIRPKDLSHSKLHMSAADRQPDICPWDSQLWKPMSHLPQGPWFFSNPQEGNHGLGSEVTFWYYQSLLGITFNGGKGSSWGFSSRSKLRANRCKFSSSVPERSRLTYKKVGVKGACMGWENWLVIEIHIKCTLFGSTLYQQFWSRCGKTTALCDTRMLKHPDLTCILHSEVASMPWALILQMVAISDKGMKKQKSSLPIKILVADMFLSM